MLSPIQEVSPVETIIVTRTEAGGSRDQAARIAIGKATINYGLKEIKAGSMGWKFIFVKAR